MQHAAEGAATLAHRLLEIARGVEPEHGLIEPAGLAADAIALIGAGRSAACRVVLGGGAGTAGNQRRPPAARARALNLLQNAADAAAAAYQPSGRSPAPPIEVEVASAGRDHVAFTVRDHGAGISPEARLRVFEPHFTTRRSARAAASGWPPRRRWSGARRPDRGRLLARRRDVHRRAAGGDFGRSRDGRPPRGATPPGSLAVGSRDGRASRARSAPGGRACSRGRRPRGRHARRCARARCGS